MIHLAIFASLAACLCFGAVLFGQIRRIDSIEDRLAYSFRRVDDNLERLDRNEALNLRDVYRLDKRLKQLELASQATPREVFFVGAGGGGGVCNSVAHGTNGRPGGAQFTPGEPHPFAADAYVSADEVLA